MSIQVHDKKGDVSKIGQICNGIRRMIHTQNLKVGDSLPAERELCEMYSASKMTVVRALERLNRQGMIRRKRGVGTQLIRLPGKEEGMLKLVFPFGSYRRAEALIESSITKELADKYNMTITTETIPNDSETVTTLKEIYYRDPEKIRGFIYVPSLISSTRDVNERAIRWFQNEDIPYVLLDRIANKEASSHYVHADNVQGGRLAAKALLKGQYDKYIYVSEGRDVTTQDRGEGFMTELEERGIAKEKVLGLKVTRDPAGWRRVVKGLLRRKMVGRSLGIFANTDSLANTIMHCLRDEGLKIPEEVGLVGFSSGNSLSEQIGLTTVIQHPQEIGAAALEMLMKQVEDPTFNIPAQAVRVDLIERDTTV